MNKDTSKYLEAWNQYKNRHIVAEKLSVCYETVCRNLRDLGIKEPATTRKYSVDETFFDVIDTEEKAYWLGFLYADGYVYNKGKKHDLHFVLAQKDEEHVRKFKEALKSEHPITQRVIKGGWSTLKKDCYFSAELYITSKHLVDSLCKAGCTQAKSLTLTFPSEDIVPAHLQRHFIRGYFDGDGSVFVSHEKHWRHGTMTKVLHWRFLGTKDMMDHIREKFTLQGRMNQKTPDVNSWELMYKRTKCAFEFFKYLYEDATIFLDRKRQIFIDFLKEKGSETTISQLEKIELKV